MVEPGALLQVRKQSRVQELSPLLGALLTALESGLVSDFEITNAGDGPRGGPEDELYARRHACILQRRWRRLGEQ